MLNPAEKQKIEHLLLELTRRGQHRASEAAAILSRLPAGAEALEYLCDLARERGLPWVEWCVPSGPPAPSGRPGDVASPQRASPSSSALVDLLTSAGPYLRKVDALLAALAGQAPGLADVVRHRLPLENDPFVLATLSSVLGQCGASEDAAVLLPLLGHADERVVANTLEALRRLSVKLPAGALLSLLEHAENRVGANALALIADSDPAQALALMRGMSSSPDPARRAGLAFILGQLAALAGATDLLISMIDAEQRTAVLKQLASALGHHVSHENAAALAGRLESIRLSSQGARRSVLDLAIARALAAGEPAVGQTPHARKPREVDEGDEDLSFSSVWGPQDRSGPGQQVPVSRNAPAAMAVSPPAFRKAGHGLTVAAACLAAAGVIWSHSASRTPETSPSRSEAAGQKRQARGKKPPPRSHITSLPPAGVNRPEPGSGDVAQSELEQHLGPIGAPVDLKGTVKGVSSGRVILRCQGRHYLVVRGPELAQVHPGDAIHVSGKLLGRSDTELFYVEAGAR